MEWVSLVFGAEGREGGSICFGCSGKPKECKHSKAKVRVSTLVDLLVELIRASLAERGKT